MNYHGRAKLLLTAQRLQAERLAGGSVTESDGRRWRANTKAWRHALRVLEFVEELADTGCQAGHDTLDCPDMHPDEPDYWCWGCHARRLMEGDAA